MVYRSFVPTPAQRALPLAALRDALLAEWCRGAILAWDAEVIPLADGRMQVRFFAPGAAHSGAGCLRQDRLGAPAAPPVPATGMLF